VTTLPDLPTARGDDRRLAAALEALGGPAAAVTLPVLAAADRSQPRGTALLTAGLADDQQLAEAFAQVAGLECVDLARTTVDLNAARLVGADVAERYAALPIAFGEDGALRVAVSDPADRVVAAEIAMLTGLTVQRVVGARGAIAAAVARLRSLEDHDVAPEPDDDVPGGPEAAGDDAPIITLVQGFIADAVDRGASDVHIELEERELRIKQRIDGVLTTVATLPAGLGPAVVSRIKILADLDISERRVPQDGRIRTRVAGRPVDLRVVTIPVVGGEAVVLRLLGHGERPLTLGEIGLEGEAAARVADALGEAHGALLVTGPTGAGKTTTLYGALQVLNRGDRSILTVEDPVEYRIQHAKQVQVNGRAGLTFATALRTLVRADPDVVMVGEIRDRETAHIAVESALTGHLVLSTLHANSAAGALVRLVEMGIEPFLVASAVRCVVAQRLVRRLCLACRRPAGPDTDVGALPRAGTVFEAVGCHACASTGYRGRLGVFEVLPVSARIRRLVLDGADADAITAAATEEGLQDLRAAAFERVLDGSTSLAEVARVIGRGGL
jgi:type IV pilus assembly protein PilB